WPIGITLDDWLKTATVKPAKAAIITAFIWEFIVLSCPTAPKTNVTQEVRIQPTNRLGHIAGRRPTSIGPPWPGQHRGEKCPAKLIRRPPAFCRSSGGGQCVFSNGRPISRAMPPSRDRSTLAVPIPLGSYLRYNGQIGRASC